MVDINIPKIAFCFLTYDNIIRYDIWNNFFQNCDKNKYVVFIHPKNIINYNHLSFHYQIVKKKIKTYSKTDIHIIKATIQLLRESYEYDEHITHFIFLSQSCIPLYSFDILYDIITKFPLSVVSVINNNKKERYVQLSYKIKRYINYINFVKQQPNMILTREDVKFFIRNDITEHFKNMQCSDEHYFINILLNILNKNVIKKQINFCNTDFHKTQALEFYNISKYFIEKIRNYGFLFMRKVNMNSNIDIQFLFNKN